MAFERLIFAMFRSFFGCKLSGNQEISSLTFSNANTCITNASSATTNCPKPKCTKSSFWMCVSQNKLVEIRTYSGKVHFGIACFLRDVRQVCSLSRCLDIFASITLQHGKQSEHSTFEDALLYHFWVENAFAECHYNNPICITQSCRKTEIDAMKSR